MVESQPVSTKQALKKLEDQLTCAICLEALKDPKLLQCFHVYCKDCLQRLVVQDRQGQLSLRCPICRQCTLLPPANVSGLQPAFHIHHLFEIQDALEKLEEPQKVQCEKCTKTTQTATKFCRGCGKFICDKCCEMHIEWEEFSKHEVVSIEQTHSNAKQLVPPKKAILYCSQHQDKELELYCETCGELICHNCTVNKHCRPEHKYDLVGDTFERHKAEITASLEPVENQLSVVNKALKQLDMQSQELNNQRAAVETNIQQQIQQLHELLEVRKTELFSQLDQQIQLKMKNLAAQKDEMETVQMQLVNCQSFLRESLRTASQVEVMKMKKSVMKQIKEMTDNLKPDMLPPCEMANVKFNSPPEVTQAYQQFGEVYLLKIYPEECYATGKGLEVAEPGNRATAVVHVFDNKGMASTRPVETVTSELVSKTTGEKINCSVKKTEANQYEISYQPMSRERHQLHIKVEGEHIKGSPFAVTVKLPVQKLGTPIKTITGVRNPLGVTVNQRSDVIVAEGTEHCISMFLPTGEKLRSFGSHGSGRGQFSGPWGVAVDGDGNILVTDGGNSRIQTFTLDGKSVSVVGKGGSQYLEFNLTRGIAIHQYNKKIYIADNGNHRIQILNPDMTFSSSFGSRGSGNGEFKHPWGVAFDSSGNVYVADFKNHRIQVFTAKGAFLRKFGKSGKDNGELMWPSSISIDRDNTVYVTECANHCVSVFTCEGKFLTSFGTKGSGPGQFIEPYGIAVDKNGVVCVSDYGNNRLQFF